MSNSSSFRPRRYASLLQATLLSVSVLLLAACGGSSGKNNSSVSSATSSSSSSSSTSSVDDSGMTLLRTEGTRWVKANGTPINLRGTNLGNWLLQEFWMMGQSTDAVNDQCTLEAVFDDRFGFDERERLMKLFRDNWIRERDWDLMQDFGLNVVRLPFIWNLLEDEHNPYTLRDDAWHYLDDAIAQAEARGMYVILDLHGAVGSQGWEHHSGCSDQNLYWTTAEYRERTIWLWEQIAERYKERDAIAGYGLLNEPWGTTPENLAAVMQELYTAVRAVDEHHIIILPGHSAGIDAYGKPADHGMTNVAFEMHFYPGIFGWGEIGYEVHRDWLRCGPNGTTGVCEWNARLTELDTPFLIGEFQPWTGLGAELGAKITRATYDTYAQYGWAATNWAYKVLTNSGGQGAGTWGMVTNQKDIGVLAKANTWACAGWDSSFNAACDANTTEFTPEGEGEQTYYLVIKAGSTGNGNLDVTLDNVSIVANATDTELVINGSFGAANGWTEWNVNGDQSIDYDYQQVAALPTGAEGSVLRLTGADVNGGIYQAITLTGGATYTLGGVFKDNNSVNSWAEIYLVSGEPETGVDVTGQTLPQMNFLTAPLEDIEALFESFGSLEYDVHEELMHWLTTDEPVNIFNLPNAPTGVSLDVDGLNAVLSWSASNGTGVTGYNIYRTTTPGANYALIAEQVNALQYADTLPNDEVTYYYTITAVTANDESYRSAEVATAIVFAAIPGTIQAENYSAMFGIQTEASSDAGSGFNVGWIDAGDWFEYEVSVQAAGNYKVEYRVASMDGSTGFDLLLNGAVIDTKAISGTGGWQNWTTVSTASVTLPAGDHTLRFNAKGGGGWNFNWVRFTAL